MLLVDETKLRKYLQELDDHGQIVCKNCPCHDSPDLCNDDCEQSCFESLEKYFQVDFSDCFTDKLITYRDILDSYMDMIQEELRKRQNQEKKDAWENLVERLTNFTIKYGPIEICNGQAGNLWYLNDDFGTSKAGELVL